MAQNPGIVETLANVVGFLAGGPKGYAAVQGVGTLFKGGETSKKYSNKLMQYRVLLQFVAIIVLIIFAYFFKN